MRGNSSTIVVFKKILKPKKTQKKVKKKKGSEESELGQTFIQTLIHQILSCAVERKNIKPPPPPTL